jgi:hypothetical protein
MSVAQNPSQQNFRPQSTRKFTMVRGFLPTASLLDAEKYAKKAALEAVWEVFAVVLQWHTA